MAISSYFPALGPCCGRLKAGYSKGLSYPFFRALVVVFTILFATAAFAAAESTSGAGETDTSGQAVQTPAVVFGGRIAGDENSTRLFFDFDRKIPFSHFFMDRPDRLVIDGPSMLFRFAEPELVNPRGLVSFLRYGAIAPGKSRIVVSLAKPVKIARFEVAEIEEGKTYRLVVDLVASDAKAFEAAVAEQRRLTGASGNVATKGDRLPATASKKEGRFTVVIDPGHGGIDGGAKGRKGTLEKDLTLEVGRKIAEKVAAAGPFDVKLTREEDIFVSLGARVEFAQRSQADLVISIHADTLRQKWVRGATVYTLSKKASDQLAEELAQSENMSDVAAGLDDPQEEDVVHDILADLTMRETNIFSRSFSSILVAELGKQVKLIKNPQRSARFIVLRAPEAPSVLLELGYLSNADEEKLMAQGEWQDNVAGQVAEAVAAFFKPRME